MDRGSEREVSHDRLRVPHDGQRPRTRVCAPAHSPVGVCPHLLSPFTFLGAPFSVETKGRRKSSDVFRTSPFLVRKTPHLFCGRRATGEQKAELSEYSYGSTRVLPREYSSTFGEVLRIGRGPSFFRWIGRWLRLFLAKPQSVEGLRSSRVWGMNQMKSEG